MMKKIILLTLFIMLMTTAFCNEDKSEERRLLTVSVGEMLSFGEHGFNYTNVGMRVHLLSDIFLSMQFDSGKLFYDTKGMYYFDQSKDRNIRFDGKIRESLVTLSLGYEFYNNQSITSYLVAGMGINFYSFDGDYADTIYVGEAETIDSIYGYKAYFSTKSSTIFSFMVGTDIRLFSWLYLSPQICYQYFPNRLEIRASDGNQERDIENLIDIYDLKNNISYGLRLSIPINTKIY